MELVFAGFFVFAIANIVLVIWALVDAIRVPTIRCTAPATS